MQPNLLIGDFIFVSKSRYGYGVFSVPFLSFVLGKQSGRILGKQPKRGDMVVFRKPNKTDEILVKRIVGLPGDSIRVVDGVLEINSQRVTRERLSNSNYRETLPNGVSYPIEESDGDNGVQDNTPLYRVPSGKYFFMGDNRDNSLDSRYGNEVGFVPYSHLVGPVVRVWFSVDLDRSFPFNVRWQRVLRSLSDIEAEERNRTTGDVQ